MSIGTNYTGSYKGIISEYKNSFKTTTKCNTIEPLLKGFGKLNPTRPCGPNFTYKDHGDFGFAQLFCKCPQDMHSCCHEKEFSCNPFLESKTNNEYCKSSDVIGAVTNNYKYRNLKKQVTKPLIDGEYCRSSDIIGAGVTNNQYQYKDIENRLIKPSLDNNLFFPGYPPSSLGKPFGPRQIYPTFGRRNVS
jgi:hypothetical protein